MRKSVLAEIEALERGIRTVFLAAGGENIARVYGRIGFERIGTACVAEPPLGSEV